jgi:hypothetical protein
MKAVVAFPRSRDGEFKATASFGSQKRQINIPFKRLKSWVFCHALRFMMMQIIGDSKIIV